MSSLEAVLKGTPSSQSSLPETLSPCLALKSPARPFMKISQDRTVPELIGKAHNRVKVGSEEEKESLDSVGEVCLDIQKDASVQGRTI